MHLDFHKISKKTFSKFYSFKASKNCSAIENKTHVLGSALFVGSVVLSSELLLSKDVFKPGLLVFLPGDIKDLYPLKNVDCNLFSIVLISDESSSLLFASRSSIIIQVCEMNMVHTRSNNKNINSSRKSSDWFRILILSKRATMLPKLRSCTPTILPFSIDNFGVEN